MQHQYMAVSLRPPGMKTEFAAHATQEMDHSNRLASVHLIGWWFLSTSRRSFIKCSPVRRLSRAGPLWHIGYGRFSVWKAAHKVYTKLIRESPTMIWNAGKANLSSRNESTHDWAD